jgi:hypothetical protein
VGRLAGTSLLSWLLMASMLSAVGCKGSKKADELKAEGTTASSSQAPLPGQDENHRSLTDASPKLAAISLKTAIYAEPNKKSKALGYLRLGEVVSRSEKPVPGAECPEAWYAVAPVGYVCTGPDATLDLRHKLIQALGVRPDTSKPMPYMYGFVRAQGALYHQVPSKKNQVKFEYGIIQHQQEYREKHTKWNRIDAAGANHVPLDEKGNPKGLPDEKLPIPAQPNESNLFGIIGDGDTPWWLRGRRQIPNVSSYKTAEFATFAGKIYRHAGVAVIGSFTSDMISGHRRFTVLLDGRLIGEDKIKPHYASAFHGIPLDGRFKFPFAIVRKAESHHYEPSEKLRWKRKGKVPFREVIQLTGKSQQNSKYKYYQSTDGRWLRYDEISVFKEPAEFPKVFNYKAEKWVDVSIWQQTLIMWEGAKPVYATMVSTGRDGMGDWEETMSTIRGEFRIKYKHITATMDADDPDNRFELRDVPWVQYFERGYALHASYWHDDFGSTRSHGCINLSPIDARRLFFWTEPHLPDHWHAVRQTEQTGKGTWVKVHG